MEVIIIIAVAAVSAFIGYRFGVKRGEAQAIAARGTVTTAPRARTRNS